MSHSRKMKSIVFAIILVGIIIVGILIIAFIRNPKWKTFNEIEEYTSQFCFGIISKLIINFQSICITRQATHFEIALSFLNFFDDKAIIIAPTITNIEPPIKKGNAKSIAYEYATC